MSPFLSTRLLLSSSLVVCVTHVRAAGFGAALQFGVREASSAVYSSSAVSPTATSLSSDESYNETALLSSGFIDLGKWQDAYDKAFAFVAGLTNAEKLEVITGSDLTSKNFTAVAYLDSTISPEDYFYVSTFSSSGAIAMSWDKDLAYRQFMAVGEEHWTTGYPGINGPVSNPMGRVPWGGRYAETFGPDAYLNGIFFGTANEALVATGCVVDGKHFLLNEQETNRLGGGGDFWDGAAVDVAYSSDVDDKALHETYLWPFYDGVKSGMGAVMCAMNRVNESYACENSKLLMKFLKSELGFPGMVLADVSGQKTAFGSANSGLDLGSSDFWSNETIQEGLDNGTLSQARFDDMAIRNLMPYYFANLNTKSVPAEQSSQTYRNVRGNHSALIREAGGKSIVLLKNEGVLPLNKSYSVSIFGSHARAVMAGPNFAFTVEGEPDTFDGHLTTPGGSAAGSLAYTVTPWYALTSRAIEDGTMMFWVMNDTYTSTGSSEEALGFGSGTGVDPSISAYASMTDICLVFMNAFGGEGADRSELRNTGQDDLALMVASECNNTMVVLNVVGPRILDAWIEHENITAVLYASMLGEQSGNSIVDVLYGDVNPSAKLTYTIARNESDYSLFKVCEEEVCDYTEGNYIDYKYFDSHNITPRFEFGFGMSYTTFAYDNSIDVQTTANLSAGIVGGAYSVGGRAELWETVATATITIMNNGTVAGAEVAQLYVAYPGEADEPLRQLRAFDKIELDAGARGTATFTLRKRDLSYWNVAVQEWEVAAGDYILYVGASSRDFRAQTTLTVA